MCRQINLKDDQESAQEHHGQRPALLLEEMLGPACLKKSGALDIKCDNHANTRLTKQGPGTNRHVLFLVQGTPMAAQQ